MAGFQAPIDGWFSAPADIQKKEGQDSAAIDLHYLADGHVAGTVFLFEHAGIEDAEVPEFLRHIDEALLPWVHLEDRTLTFTVVRGHVVGDFQPDKGEAGTKG